MEDQLSLISYFTLMQVATQMNMLNNDRLEENTHNTPTQQRQGTNFRTNLASQ